MSKVGAYEAKTHLPKLLERVQEGERFTITKHGRPVAELVPVGGRDAYIVASAIEDLRALKRRIEARDVRSEGLRKKGESLRDLAHRGHRHLCLSCWIVPWRWHG